MDCSKYKFYWDYAIDDILTYTEKKMKGKTKVKLLDGSEMWAGNNPVYVTYPLENELKIPVIPLTSRPTPKEVIFNPPATIVYWMDGTRTVVKCSEEDLFSEEVGFVMCFVKKCLGNKHSCSTYIREFLKGAKRCGNKDNSPKPDKPLAIKDEPIKHGRWKYDGEYIC